MHAWMPFTLSLLWNPGSLEAKATSLQPHTYATGNNAKSDRAHERGSQQHPKFKRLPSRNAAADFPVSSRLNSQPSRRRHAKSGYHTDATRSRFQLRIHFPEKSFHGWLLLPLQHGMASTTRAPLTVKLRKFAPPQSINTTRAHDQQASNVH
jgi:hypothetical protein